MKTPLRLILSLLAAGACITGALAKNWETDFTKATAEAKRTGRYLLMDFTGSDWCPGCIRLDREVFETQAFKEYARKNLVCVVVDFPKTFPQPVDLQVRNAELQEKFGVQGYPTVLLLSPDGEEVVQTGYRRGGAAAYIEYLQERIDAHRQKPAPAKP